MNEFARKHSLYSAHLPVNIKLVLAHEYYDYTTRWMWVFERILNKLDLPGKYKTDADNYGYSPSQYELLAAIAESGVAIISYCYDPLMKSYCQHELGLI